MTEPIISDSRSGVNRESRESRVNRESKERQITNSTKQDTNNDRKQGFEVIWFYCYLKYFQGKQFQQGKKQQQQQTKSPIKQKQQQKIVKNNYLISSAQQPQSQQQQSQSPQIQQIQHQPLTSNKISQLLRQLKQHYCIQTIQRHSQQYSLNSIKERALLSRNDRFFVIEPQQEIKEIEQMLRGASVSARNGMGPMEGCLEDMVIELYSYYLNSKNVYLIYKKTNTNHNNIVSNTTNNINTSIIAYQNNSISSSIDSTQNRLKMILTHNSSQSKLNTSKDSKCGSVNDQRNERRSYGSLKSRLGRNNNNKLLAEQDSIGNLVNNNNNLTHGESLTINQGDKMDNKIQQMQVIDKFGEFDGLELWNIKYKKIPHTFVKFKKQSWTKCLNLPLIHPSVPKTINELPIIPRITKLNPSIDKLLPFVSLIKMLQKYFPNLLPSIESIYEYNNMPYVFFEEDNGYGSWKWETNIGVLCYFVVYGNDEETLSIKKVERWVEQNGETLLGRTIKEMTKRQKEKNRKRKEVLRNVGMNNNNSNINGKNSDNDNSNINNNENTNNHSNNNHTTPHSNQPLPTISTTVTPTNSSLQMLITKDENSDLAIW